jgi:FMN-dependent NADH-azoreductase
MKKILHIVATPREDASRTLSVSREFLRSFQEVHPEYVVDELNLVKESVPDLTMKRVDGKYVLLGGKDLFGDLQEAWTEITQHIDRFMSADLYLVSSPMWNFGIPYMLKKYIDVIVQPKFLFRYTPTGVEGLVKNKKMVVITSRGGEYVTEDSLKMDFQEPYLRTIFAFVGLNDITFINAQPMDMGMEKQQERLKRAIEEAKALAVKI